MGLALAQARLGLAEGAMPIGAVLVCDGEILGRAYWKGLQEGFLKHPEHELLVGADRTIPWKLRGESTLYTTLEPCLMCMGTAMSFFLGRIVYAMPAPADGASNVYEQWNPAYGHPEGQGAYACPTIDGGVCAADARALVVSWLGSGAGGVEADFARRTLGL